MVTVEQQQQLLYISRSALIRAHCRAGCNWLNDGKRTSVVAKGGGRVCYISVNMRVCTCTSIWHLFSESQSVDATRTWGRSRSSLLHLHLHTTTTVHYSTAVHHPLLIGLPYTLARSPSQTGRGRENAGSLAVQPEENLPTRHFLRLGTLPYKRSGCCCCCAAAAASQPEPLTNLSSLGVLHTVE